jgi:RNA polymerase sigma-70 factor, ECF subfamily
MRRDPFHDPAALIDRVYAYVSYRIGSGPDAEDVTSEAFERALRYRDSFDPAKGDPTSWVIGIARRCLQDRPVLRTLDAELELAQTGDLEHEAVERLQLLSAVNALDLRERELIALRYGADLTTRQIAKLLDLRANTVDVALHRALKRLRELLTVADRTSESLDDESVAAEGQ